MTIENAVEIIESESFTISQTANEFMKAVDVLYKLGKEYVGIEGFPKEAKMPKCGFNVALHLCKLVAIKKNAECKSQLGCATTRELIDEIRARIEVNGNLEYRTVDMD